MTMSDTRISVFVSGAPIPQGSMKHVGHGRIIHANAKELKAWRDHVGCVVKQYIADEGIDILSDDKRYIVSLEFFLRRPKSVSKKKRPHPTKKPDLDKLVRAILDSLTGIVWGDDAQVTCINADKGYDDEPHGCDDGPGVIIFIVGCDNRATFI